MAKSLIVTVSRKRRKKSLGHFLTSTLEFDLRNSEKKCWPIKFENSKRKKDAYWRQCGKSERF